MSDRGDNRPPNGGYPPEHRPRRPPETNAPAPLAAAPLVPIFEPLDVFATPLARPQLSPSNHENIAIAILGVMARVKEVPRLGFNKEFRFDYVRYQDLAALLQDAMVAEGLVITPREVHRAIAGKVLFIRYQFDAYHRNGGYILNICEGTGACRFEFKVGSTDDKAAVKCATSASKTVYTMLFKIPSDVDQDIERDAPLTDRDGNLTGERMGDPGEVEHERRDMQQRTDLSADRPREHTSSVSGDRQGPPPDFDDVPPFDGPTDGSGSAPPSDPDPMIDFRRNVQNFADSLKNARDIGEADRIWVENSSLITSMADDTYEHFRANFVRRWNQAPPQ